MHREYLCRFDDNGVPGGEASGHLPGEHHERIVPGRDQAAHADRFPLRDGQVPVGPRVVDWDRRPLDLVAPS